MNLKKIDFIKNDCADVLTSGDIFKLSALKNEAIFLSGGSGFMGKWILEMIHYLNSHHNFNTKICVYSPSAEKLKVECPHLFTSHPAELITGDTKHIFDIKNEFSWVIHAAATPDNRLQSTNPMRIFETINTGTNNMLEAASRLPDLKNFLNISSGHVYGLNLDSSGEILSQVKENQFGSLDCSSVNSLYAEAKRMGETLCATYRAQYRMPITSLRPFAFIGPHQQLDRPWAINNFFNDVLHNMPIKILGNDETIRSYMYPSDMAYWVLSFLANSKSSQTLNLGNDDGRSLKNVAETVSDAFSNSVPIHFSGNRRNASKSVFVPNINKSKELFDLDISVDFETAIKKTTAWFKL